MGTCHQIVALGHTYNKRWKIILLFCGMFKIDIWFRNAYKKTLQGGAISVYKCKKIFSCET